MVLNTEHERREAIKEAFAGDTDIYKFFDPNISVSTLDDVVENVSSKIEEYYSVMPAKFVKTYSGYVFFSEGFLISFGCRKECRGSWFWNEIVEQLGGKFLCALWDTNTRAIRWLEKNGMVIIKQENNIVLLCL
jgi:hypothetical protein